MNLHVFTRRLLFLPLAFIFFTAIAQKTPQQIQELKQRLLTDPKVAVVVVDAERQTPSFISFKKGGGSISKNELRQKLGGYLNLRGGIDDVKLSREVSASGNFGVVEFHQYYKGIKVEHSRYTALVKGTEVVLLNGAFFNVPENLPLKARLNVTDALSKAKGKVNAKKYSWESVAQAMGRTKELGTKAALAAEFNEYDPKGELVIIKDYNKEGIAEMHLAYKFNIYAFEPLSRDWVYVDAMNGNILLVDKIIKHVDNPAPSSTSISSNVQTRYAGTKNIQVKQISGNDPNNGALLTSSNPLEVYIPGSATYVLMDDSRGNGIETYDLNGIGGLPITLGTYAAAKSFTDVDNNWTLAEHKRGGAVESENDDFGWDAHWGAAMVYDYWKLKHGRLSFDGNNAKIKSFIHSGLAYDNAFWNGTVMTYGDGSYPAKANGFKPLTSLDVCGHEIGHGVCEFTADLVYANESGAMNEGFSDIWAACVEYYVLKTVDQTLSAVYKPFSIGEQIAANSARPLRRMDSPQAEGDPDTYGGNFWKDPNCSPNLANDQCGVHTNSGVLNKWFYLVSVGSGAGSGPDAAFAGVDDEINDKGNSYSITGLGFDVSEKIAYLTELMLTSSATYAEARNVSINIATALSGSPYSPLVKTVTNSWFAVGVGSSALNEITYGFVYQPGSSISEGQEGAGCNLETAVYIPVLLPANSTATFNVSGTATNTSDYRLSTTTLSNSTTNFKSDSIIVYVKDDGVVEGNETVVLNITLTNAGTSPVNSKYILNIIEDDVNPVISLGTKNLLNETFTRADGFTDPAGWKEVIEIPESAADPLARGRNQWGIFSNALAITGKEGTTGVQLAGGTYNSNSTSKTLIGSSIIDGRGLSRLRFKFDYTVQGEINTEGDDPFNLPAFDYMAIVYSFDGVTWYELSTPPYRAFASAAPEIGKFDAYLPGFLTNKFFYIGFRWFNDTNAGGPVSVSIDNLTLDGSSRTIENDLNHNGRENLGAGDNVYFYSVQDGEVLGRIQNNSTKDFGCTNVFVEKTGTGAFNLYQGRDGLHKVADKIIRIETGFIYKASTTVALYYTDEQLKSLEAATGASRNNFSVYQVSAVSYNLATSQNTKKYSAVFTTLGEGLGGFYTITFNEKANGSYAVGATVSVLGNQNTVTFSERNNELLLMNWKFNNLYPNPGQGTARFSIYAPRAEKVKLEIVNVFGQLVQTQNEQLIIGQSQVLLRLSNLSNGSYLIRVRDEKGNLLNSQSYIKY